MSGTQIKFADIEVVDDFNIELDEIYKQHVNRIKTMTTLLKTNLSNLNPAEKLPLHPNYIEYIVVKKIYVIYLLHQKKSRIIIKSR